MPFTEIIENPRGRSTLAALIDRLIPEDNWPGGWSGGVGMYLDAERSRDLAWASHDLDRVRQDLDRRAAEHEVAFADADDELQDALVGQLAENASLAAALTSIVRIAYEGYYGGNRESRPAGWDMLGFDPGRHPPAQVGHGFVETKRWDRLADRYDAIVIGTGAGGGVSAQVMAEQGQRVLLIERAPARTDEELRGDHLRGKRMALYRPTAGPGPGNPRLLEGLDGPITIDGDGPGDAWGLNAMCLGGGTRLWQGMAWRLSPEDFAMADVYGRPLGTDLVNWPTTYADLEPYYTRVEHDLGVCGTGGALHDRTPRSKTLPMRALPDDLVRSRLTQAAERRGWPVGPIPFAINSVRRHGRRACIACGQCIGHACPVDAKNGTHNTYIPRAIATGNCDLLMDAQVVRIDHRHGTAHGVTIAVGTTQDPHKISIRAPRIVVAGGAVETPRLLLASGLGNEHVGRHLHGHRISLVAAQAPESLPRFRGPGHSVATTAFIHDGTSPAGGGVLFDMSSPYPLQFAHLASAFGVPAYGSGHKAWMKEGTRRLIGVMGMGQDLPSNDRYLRLDTRVRDRRGVPAAVFRAGEDPLTRANQAYLTSRSAEWLTEANCENIIDIVREMRGPAGARIPATEHSAGTARMGDDPDRSAVDRYGKVHGTGNVYVVDASALPTSGGVNPALTIMANALRMSESWSSSDHIHR